MRLTWRELKLAGKFDLEYGTVAPPKMVRTGCGVFGAPTMRDLMQPIIADTLGPTTLRMSLWEQAIKPAANITDLDARLAAFPCQDLIDAVIIGGGDVIFTIHGVPDASPTAWQAYGNITTSCATAFAAQAAYWEIWNEVSNFFPSSVADCLDMASTMWAAIRAVDSGAKISTPNVATVDASKTPSDQSSNVPIIQRAYERAESDGITLDWASWHSYNGQNQGLALARISPEHAEAHRQAAGLGYVPELADTEWNSGASGGSALNATERCAAFTAVKTAIYAERGVTMHAKQTMSDPGSTRMGLLSVTGLIHPVCIFYQWLKALGTPKKVWSDDDNVGVFQGPDGVLIGVWEPDNTTQVALRGGYLSGKQTVVMKRLREGELPVFQTTEDDEDALVALAGDPPAYEALLDSLNTARFGATNATAETLHINANGVLRLTLGEGIYLIQ